VVGANARRVVEIANQFPHVRISVLVENEGQVRQWRGSSVGVFVDINPGMNRTGVEQGQTDQVVRLVRAIEEAELRFSGLHYYDGQHGGLDEPERTAAAHAGYDRLLRLVIAIEDSGVSVPEVITAGTPTFPCSLAYKVFTAQASSTVSRLEQLSIAMLQVWHNCRLSTATRQRRWY
jgi:3-hydroxy-D-aspartate aldolase